MNNQPTLKPGDEVRIIAPSSSWTKHRAASYDRAQQALEGLGLKVSFGKNLAKNERFGTAAVADRLADLHDAYRDPAVKLVMALGGGWSGNALLPGMDWDLIARNPKPLIGFSDITVLVNALYARTGQVQYLGPNFGTLGRRNAAEYTLENFRNVLTGTGEISLKRSRQWLRKYGEPLAKTRPWKILQSGTAEGVLLGGNLGTFYLLQGTANQPVFDKPYILAAEDDDEAGTYSAREFDRRLESLLQLPGARQNLQGMLIGRNQPSSKVTMPDIAHIVQRLNLGDIPVVADMDFGHTVPMVTLPIGGTVRIEAKSGQPQINLVKY
jgi:muramoyltetrapeptide carboxypeptidase